MYIFLFFKIYIRRKLVCLGDVLQLGLINKMLLFMLRNFICVGQRAHSVRQLLICSLKWYGTGIVLHHD